MAYALIAAAIFTVGAPICIARISEWLQKWPSGDWYFWPTLILFYLALANCIWRTPTKQRMLHVICFPPAWVAAIGGMCVIVLMWWLLPETLEALLHPFASRASLWQSAWELCAKACVWTLVPVCVVVVVRWCALRTRGARRQGVINQLSGSLPPLDYDSICQWIRDDREIETPSQDRFGHAAVAERMADRLTRWISGKSSEKPDIVLVGEIGSGKTSILRLTKRILQTEKVNQEDIKERKSERKGKSAAERGEEAPKKKMGERKGKSEQNTVFVQVSLWPFDTPEAAVRGVLDSLVQEIGQYISPIALTGLSTSYLQAVEKLGPLGVVIASLTQGLSSPTAILRTLDEAALAADLHVLLWVEDLERFARAEANNDPHVASRTYEKLNPIRSLLYQLHGLERVCVVVAAQSLDEHFDVEKIARYVERPPRMSVETAWGIIHEFRAGCLKSSLEDGTWRLAQKDLGKEAVRRQVNNEHNVLETVVDVRAAVVELCAQPRMLKTALRSCLDAHERLNDTIDFDSVLLLSVIRAAAPEVFAVIERFFWRLATAKYSYAREIVDRPPSGEKRNAAQQIVFVEFFLGRDASALDEVLGWGDRQLDLAKMRLEAAVSGENPQAPSRPRSFVGPGAEERWRSYLSLSPIASAADHADDGASADADSAPEPVSTFSQA